MQTYIYYIYLEILDITPTKYLVQWMKVGLPLLEREGLLLLALLSAGSKYFTNTEKPPRNLRTSRPSRRVLGVSNLIGRWWHRRREFEAERWSGICRSTHTRCWIIIEPRIPRSDPIATTVWSNIWPRRQEDQRGCTNHRLFNHAAITMTSDSVFIPLFIHFLNLSYFYFKINIYHFSHINNK